MQPHVAPFHHAATGTWSYVVADPVTRVAAIIDPVLDYDWKSARTATHAAGQLIAHCREQGLDVRWILETHAHADHLSAAQHLKREIGGEIAIGAGITSVQRTFKRLFGLGTEFQPDGSQFDRLLEDDCTLPLGSMQIHVLPTPGHTNDSVSFLIGDAVFIGDTLFMPDAGSARCDFPGGNAAELYRSVQRLFTLPAGTRVFVCHDYSPGGRAALCETTIEAQRRSNTHIREGVDEATFVQMRRERDATLDVPNLIIPSVQVNIRAGRLPPAEADGTSYLRVPLDVFGRPKP
ncbi:MAG: MBL fold metallo-hydrolase [Gammaproteobacteria bacterium]|nr:MBL fold metallo-hydrolase [Gammaproteobacteria bacterium]MDH5175151.1 MBL fold metallo-hydrolase [Gammaproteobacteria bacterium]MDH5227509.1 MBL fold metallo-hydrolase [Gammaproteobacteria bacterium]